MSEWKEYKLGEVYEFASGLSKGADQFGYGYEFLSFKDVFQYYFLPNKLSSLVNSSEKERNSCSIKKGDIFLTRTSETQEELGMSSVALKDYPNATFNGFTKRLRPKGIVEIVPEYAGYYFRSPKFRANVTSMSSMTTRASLNNDMLNALKFIAPPTNIQQIIGGILKSLDDKIDLMLRQNATLEKLAETLFRQLMSEQDLVGLQDGQDEVKDKSCPSNNPENRVQDYVVDEREEWEKDLLGNQFDIGIGRTPPRKEPQWFSENPMNIKWVSIKDMGSSGVYISSTSEYLTQEAVNKFSIPIIPENTVMLSFKMTIGRLAISKENMVSNEAIAHFKTKATSKLCPEFLYLYLKTYQWEQLGSTSSIVDAINSQMIKEMDVLIPEEKLLSNFKHTVEPYFKKIKSNQTQIRTLTALRNTLLPKLMSGEVRLSEHD